MQVKGFAPQEPAKPAAPLFDIDPDALYSQSQAARLVGTDRAHMWYVANSANSPIRTYTGTNGSRVFLGSDLIAYRDDPRYSPSTYASPAAHAPHP